MTQFTHSSLVLTILRHVSSDRLQRAVCGFADGRVVFSICWWCGLNRSPKLVTIYKEANYRIVHEDRFRETNGFAC
jgi:hypothetical protein